MILGLSSGAILGPYRLHTHAMHALYARYVRTHCTQATHAHHAPHACMYVYHVRAVIHTKRDLHASRACVRTCGVCVSGVQAYVMDMRVCSIIIVNFNPAITFKSACTARSHTHTHTCARARAHAHTHAKIEQIE